MSFIDIGKRNQAQQIINTGEAAAIARGEISK
jgi:hypothetical protein